MNLIVTPTAITHRTEQNEQRAKPQQATSGAARAAGRRAVLNFALRLANRLGFAGSEKLNRSSVVLNASSFQSFGEYAMCDLAVGASAQRRKQIWHE